MAVYTPQEYYDMLIVYGECDEVMEIAARRYAEKFPRRRHPYPNVFLRAAIRLRETGSVLIRRPDAGRDRGFHVQLEEDILDLFSREPEMSIRGASNRLGVSYGIIQRTLAAADLHDYHYTRVQHLREEDFPIRLEFCEWFLQQAEEDADFSKFIIFSDESLFTREGIFNSRNWHIWSDENPHALRIRNNQVRWKMNIWAGILGTNILGPIVLPDILDGNAYLRFLRENLPEFVEDVPLDRRGQLIFQQDGAPPHNKRCVTNFLDRTFPDRWMGRFGPLRWPARSPDLNPLDFFLWGHCKQFVYRDIPQTLEDLDMKLHCAFGTITEDMLERVHRNLIRRMQACIRNGGGQFEHEL